MLHYLLNRPEGLGETPFISVDKSTGKITLERAMPLWQMGITGQDFDPSNGSPIVLYNSETNKKEVIECESYNLNDYPKSIYTPIGIIVIPKYHMGIIKGEDNAYDVMMSLKYMRYDNPDNGGEMQKMYAGPNIEMSTVDITDRCYAIMYDMETNNYTFSTFSFSPSDIYFGAEGTIESESCSGIYYMYNGYYAGVTPFVLSDDGKLEPNEKYYSQEFAKSMAIAAFNSDDNDDVNIDVDNFSVITNDFEGKANTQELIAQINDPNWRNSSTIENLPKNYPTAACCWRYSTIGTTQGEWYLPSMGELGYIIPFMAKHKIAVEKINEVYGENTSTLIFTMIDLASLEDPESGYTDEELAELEELFYTYLISSTNFSIATPFYAGSIGSYGVGELAESFFNAIAFCEVK